MCLCHGSSPYKNPFVFDLKTNRLWCVTFRVCLFIQHRVLRFIHNLAWVAILPFSWLNNIPVGGYITCCLSVHSPVDTGLFSPLWVMLLWTHQTGSLQSLSVLSSICLGIYLLDYMVIQCLNFFRILFSFFSDLWYVQLWHSWPGIQSSLSGSTQ